MSRGFDKSNIDDDAYMRGQIYILTVVLGYTLRQARFPAGTSHENFLQGVMEVFRENYGGEEAEYMAGAAETISRLQKALD